MAGMLKAILPRPHAPLGVKRTLSLSWIRKRALAIAPEETSFARRGFHSSDPDIRQHLEQVGSAFLRGYNSALDYEGLCALAEHLSAVESEFRGFAFEGAAMCLSLLDFLSPWKKRLAPFLDGPARPHIYMAYVGMGWAAARLRRPVRRVFAGLDPLLRWLVVDGHGFHEGYFHSDKYVRRRALPRLPRGYAQRVFDQGLGRSLWFIEGADIWRIHTTVTNFPMERRADLWSGVGLACAYAGGLDHKRMKALPKLAQPFEPHLAQGAAFAAKARLRAGISSTRTDLACQVLCGMTSSEAARITDLALEDLPGDGQQPSYEVWRDRIRSHFSGFQG
jgi:hypothetical protein